MLNVDKLLEEALLLEEVHKYEKWRFFTPAPKQLEFLNAGAEAGERLLMAGNGNGKTECAAYETACHLIGEYPPWWKGFRYNKPPVIWVGGESGIAVRDAAQEKLFGSPGDPDMLGTGLIPKAAILGEPSAGRSAPNSIESARIKWRGGRGTSRIVFKTYSQERKDWQGSTIDGIWFDEEPPEELYAEGIARLRGKGRAWMTFTPLKGFTQVVKRFMEDDSGLRRLVRMGLKDCPWYTAEEIERQINQYPPHERDARINGTPLLGEGNVFQTPIEDLLEDPIPHERIPEHWCLIWGIDFGIDHPFAAVLLAWDKDIDTIHILYTIRMRGALPVQHADTMKRIGGNVPVAWPHDGHQREKTSGKSLSEIYRAQGLRMMPSHATHPEGGFSLYAGILGLSEYMRGGRFKVNRTLSDWQEEYRMYHYKDGQIVKINDDLMSATRIAFMEKRSAKPVKLGPASKHKPNPPAGSPARIAIGADDYRLWGY